MKNFETLMEAGIEQAAIEYVASLMRVYLGPSGGEETKLLEGMGQAAAKYDTVKRLIEEQ
jgi:hypothetical protein